MTKLDDALAYLRSRNKYCLDRGNTFKWKSGADVAKTANAEERRLKELDRPTPNVTVLKRKERT